MYSLEAMKNPTEAPLKNDMTTAGQLSAEERRVNWLLPTSTMLWLVSFFVARVGLKALSFGSAEAVLLALLPIPFFALFLWTYVRAIALSDELERRIQLEALAFAFPLTVLLLMLLGLLELATELSPDDLSYRHVWAFLPLLYVGGLVLARRRR